MDIEIAMKAEKIALGFWKDMSIKNFLSFLLAAVISSLTLSMTAVADNTVANNGGLDSIRSSELNVEPPAESLKKIKESDTVLPRDFVQLPPMIPHDVRGYTVNKDVNSCLRCHGWKNASKWGATRISVTHYYDRDGKQLADMAPRRYFCQQCHVVQNDAKPLKKNTFEPVDSLK